MSAAPTPAQPLVEPASWVRRAVALGVDWIASTLVVVAFMGAEDYYRTGDPVPGLYTLGVFILESTFLTSLAGGSFGKLATRLRVVRWRDGGAIGPALDPARALLRSVLVALVIPPLVFRPDGRGLHDVAVGSATVPVGSGSSVQ